MVIRKIRTTWPIAEYSIVTIGHGYGLFKGHNTLIDTSYDLPVLEVKLNNIQRSESW